jgi:hypothetical protein
MLAHPDAEIVLDGAPFSGWVAFSHAITAFISAVLSRSQPLAGSNRCH